MLSKLKLRHKDEENEPIHYWMVTFTLTSGKSVQFYVKAITLQEAQKTAEEFRFVAENPKLQSGNNRLLLKH